ncbi:MAG: hypothetical protein EOO50_11695 [Flavobacterium sp.]|uniref:hypothetical protein n=1 Tax=Flavobacterium sp. TaxID=239 RepID=UPI0012101C07|nr:hypothetical protein [Flavobacterium sp.]RZJ65923.1 MAG: hypothetical protein EOO50_11695 [Flavobacterium sp.]
MAKSRFFKLYALTSFVFLIGVFVCYRANLAQPKSDQNRLSSHNGGGIVAPSLLDSIAKRRHDSMVFRMSSSKTVILTDGLKFPDILSKDSIPVPRDLSKKVKPAKP